MSEESEYWSEDKSEWSSFSDGYLNETKLKKSDKNEIMNNFVSFDLFANLSIGFFAHSIESLIVAKLHSQE